MIWLQLQQKLKEGLAVDNLLELCRIAWEALEAGESQGGAERPAPPTPFYSYCRLQ